MGSDISFTFRKIILYQQWLVETWTRREDTWTFNHHFDVYWPYLVDSENFEMINLFYLTCKPTFSSDTVFYTEPQKNNLQIIKPKHFTIQHHSVLKDLYFGCRSMQTSYPSHAHLLPKFRTWHNLSSQSHNSLSLLLLPNHISSCLQVAMFLKQIIFSRLGATGWMRKCIRKTQFFI